MEYNKYDPERARKADKRWRQQNDAHRKELRKQLIEQGLWKDPNKKDYGMWIFSLILIVIIGGYLYLDWISTESEPDCTYTNQGCYGDHNRWGQ